MKNHARLQAEYGSCGNVRFANPEQVKMYYADGTEVLCKCGKPAGMGCMGLEAYLAWCDECSPLGKGADKFVSIDTNSQ
jgi:hypothetical protein